MKSRTEISATWFKVLSPSRSVFRASAASLASLSYGLQRPVGIEVRHWQIDAVGLQLFQTIRPNAGGAKTAVNIACFVGVLLHEAIDVLHLDLFTLHARDLAEAHDLALAVRQALQLHDDRYGRRDLTADAADGRRHARHGDHLLKPLERITRRIRVNRRH